MRVSVLGVAIAGLLVVLPAVPASAGEALSAEASGTAEQRLRHLLQMDPDDPAVLARLARLYAANDRPTKAKRLYSAMLTLEDVELERTAGAPVSSRLLARSALKQLDAPKPVRMGLR